MKRSADKVYQEYTEELQTRIPLFLEQMTEKYKESKNDPKKLDVMFSQMVHYWESVNTGSNNDHCLCNGCIAVFPTDDTEPYAKSDGDTINLCNHCSTGVEANTCILCGTKNKDTNISFAVVGVDVTKDSLETRHHYLEHDDNFAICESCKSEIEKEEECHDELDHCPNGCKLFCSCKCGLI